SCCLRFAFPSLLRSLPAAFHPLSLHDALPIFRNPTLLLRALSALLTYPDAELRAALPEIRTVISSSRALKKRYKNDVLALIDELDRKSTRLNSSHVSISYAVFCLKKKK